MPGTARLEAYFQALTSGNRQVFRDLCASVMFRTSEVADGASAVAHYLDTSAAYTTPGAKLLSLRNATVEKFSVGYDGTLQSPGTLYLGSFDQKRFMVVANEFNPVVNQAMVLGGTFSRFTALFLGASLTASAPGIDLTQTWNSGVTTFKAFTVDITDTASASGSLLADFMVGGVSKFSVGKTKMTSSVPLALDIYGVTGIGQYGYTLLLYGNNDVTNVGTAQMGVNGTTVFLGSTTTFGWCSSAAVNGLMDTILARDAAGILAQRNGTNAQIFKTYETFTDTGNYSRGVMGFDGVTSVFKIGTERAGTGSVRPIYFMVGGSNVWTINTGNALAPLSGGNYDLGTSGLPVRAAYLGGASAIVASAPALNITQAWNSGAVDFIGILADFTSTASGAGSLLMDLRLGGASKFRVSKDGAVDAFALRAASNYIALYDGVSTYALYVNQARLSLASDMVVNWSSTTEGYAGTKDLGLARASAGVVEINNGTAGTYRDLIARNLELTGTLKFGTHSAIGAETVTGYVTITDAAGNSRKLAVVS